MSDPVELCTLLHWCSSSVATRCGRKTIISLRLVHSCFSFDPDVLYHIRTIISTLLRGSILDRIGVTVFTCPGPFSDTRLFQALYDDIEFICDVFEKTWRPCCSGLLEAMPRMGFSLELTLTVVCTKDYAESTTTKAVVQALQLLSWCTSQGPITEYEMSVVILIMEELLVRAGLYAGSISIGEEHLLCNTWRTGYAIMNVTALTLFMAIPEKLLCGDHLRRVCDSYTCVCEDWKEIMRRALDVYRNYRVASVLSTWEEIMTTASKTRRRNNSMVQ